MVVATYSTDAECIVSCFIGHVYHYAFIFNSGNIQCNIVASINDFILALKFPGYLSVFEGALNRLVDLGIHSKSMIQNVEGPGGIFLLVALRQKTLPGSCKGKHAWPAILIHCHLVHPHIVSFTFTRKPLMIYNVKLSVFIPEC